MENFEYVHPAKLKDAVAMLGNDWADAAVLAGGTDLLSLMKDYVEKPKRLVNIKGIGELEGIRADKKGTTIGALVTIEELRTNSAIGKDFPSIVKAAAGIASAQMRTMGTVAGELCQRPRCWYFRGGFGLLAQDAGGKSLVPGGENKYHAIFGNDGPAYFVSPLSLAPALIALNATATFTGPGGSRDISLLEFLPDSQIRIRTRARTEAERNFDAHHDSRGIARPEQCNVRSSPAGDARLAARDGERFLQAGWLDDTVSANPSGTCRAHPVERDFGPAGHCGQDLVGRVGGTSRRSGGTRRPSAQPE